MDQTFFGSRKKMRQILEKLGFKATRLPMAGGSLILNFAATGMAWRIDNKGADCFLIYQVEGKS